MTLFGASELLIGITSTAFAILVFIHNPKNPLNRIWGIFGLSVAIWGWGGYAFSQASTEAIALFWWRITHIGVIFIPVFFTHFVYIFLNIPKRGIVYGTYLLGLLYLFLNATPYFIKEVGYLFDSFYYLVHPTPLYSSFVFCFLAATVYTHYLLYRSYQTVTREKQNQILYFFLATAIGFSGGVTSFLPAFGVMLYPVLNFSVVLYPIIMSYAIVRHNLFDIKVVATEVLVGGIAIALFIEIFFSQTLTETVLRSLLFLLTSGLGFLLIRSVIREVRQREQLEILTQKLEIANAELKKLDKVKSEFISIASHQLRAPLTVIHGYTSLILEGSLGKISEKLREVLERVSLSSMQLVKLIRDLLDLSRIESGKIKYEFKKGNFVKLVEEVIKEFIPSAEKRELTIVFENRIKNLQNFLFDPDKMREVIINFIDNAIKYSTEGAIQITLERTGGNLRFGVKDNGIGIKPEDQKRLFTKFMRTEEAHLKDSNGLGIGLYFAKRVAEDHSGMVWAESEGLGKGSTFFVEIPIKVL